MKRILAALLFASSCATPTAGLQLSFTDGTELDRDQVLVCPYLKQNNMIVCMTPDEFRFRVEAARDQ